MRSAKRCRAKLITVDLFAEMVRSGVRPLRGPERHIRGFKSRAPRSEDSNGSTEHKERGK